MRLPSLRKAPSPRKALWCVVTSAALALAALAAVSGPAGAAQVASSASTAAAGASASTASASSAAASSLRPCNIYAAGGTPCVAAYSTVRALYRGYRGPLYQLCLLYTSPSPRDTR